MLIKDFNSIKVRLKQRVQRGYMVIAVDFNSIKVRLKRIVTFAPLRSSLNFNSIKVRLKPAVNSYYPYYVEEFQFHKGTIKTAVM